jgi:uncharacterized protein
MSQQENSRAIDYGATVVITHRVRSGMHPLYDTWLNEIVPLCRDAVGFLDWQIVRPVAGLTSTYTVIIRFDTPEHLRAWMISSQRRRLIEQVRPLLAKDDDFIVRSGLDFWFTPEGAQAKIPSPWKQWLATWSAIYPLVLLVPLFVNPLLRWFGIPSNYYLDTLAITGAVVSLMVFIVMPRYTRLLSRWLFD